MEKAKEGREDTVSTFCFAGPSKKNVSVSKYVWLKQSSNPRIVCTFISKKWVSVCAEGEKLSAEGAGGSERGEDSPAGRVGEIQGV